MARPLIVVALGGNAISPKGVESVDVVWANVRRASRALLEAYLSGFNLIVTHGNGPQAGYLLEAIEALPRGRPRQTLDLVVAMTQGWIGYLIVHSILIEARRMSRDVNAVALVTRVLVDPNDEAFANPSKPVGFYYSAKEAERLARERGWVMKPDPRGGYRRVVPSPKPIGVIEAPIIEKLARSGTIVVAVGGGGIPVSASDFSPVEAVIDKDLATSLLARLVGADRFIILTDVPGVAVNYRRPGERWLSRIHVDELERYAREGHFPAGSMGPKVQAAIEFVKATGRPAAIGSLDNAPRVIKLESGTIIEP